ncbi:hypothetical protein ACHQM5_005715 [Ranunculus cassubicifolius]
MRACSCSLSGIVAPNLIPQSLPRGASSIPRGQIFFPRQHLPLGQLHRVKENWKIWKRKSQNSNLFRANCVESGVEGEPNFKEVPSALLIAEKEEAKAVLSLFLRRQGYSNAAASRTIKKSQEFIEHLLSKLHTAHKTRYLVGRELTTPEIRDTLIPYLEFLVEEQGDDFVDMVENFPTPSPPTASTPNPDN